MLPWRREEHPAGIDKFRGILVAIGDNPMDEAVVKFACWLTKGTKTPIYAVHVIEMPWTEPVDASPDEDVSMRADKVLERAQAIADSIGARIDLDLLQARTAGTAIVDEATARDCDLIVVGLPYKRKHGEYYMGTTIPYILEHAPMKVIVLRGTQS